MMLELSQPHCKKRSFRTMTCNNRLNLLIGLNNSISTRSVNVIKTWSIKNFLSSNTMIIIASLFLCSYQTPHYVLCETKPTSTNKTSNNKPENQQSEAKDHTSFISSISSAIHFPPTKGPIEDALCRIEDLEQANDSQLHTILHELIQTPFFRTFVVDLDRKCPLQSWNVVKPRKPESDDNPTKVESSKKIVGFGAKHKTSSDEEETDEYQCTGGVDELDEEAEPLCSVNGGNDGFDTSSFDQATGGFNFGKSSPMSKLESNALYSLSKDGFVSKSQQEAFSWKDITDEVIEEDINEFDPTCDEPGKNNSKRSLPDAFWHDMCRNLQVDSFPTGVDANTHKNVVNLLLNPERNTGYNGTHIWRAIYEENCITVDGDDSHMCLEERVLYRLLSGLHTSTTISIAKNYYPPSKRKNRLDWESHPEYFMSKFAPSGKAAHNDEKLGIQNDHIRNLHFSFAVMLRALHKASPFLYDFASDQKNLYTGNTVEDETASILLRRLLDSAILKSCSSVFTAFDESLMFQEQSTLQVPNDVVSLQQNFKGVFHNVSSILDCVQCQQCKLHGKMAMLGYGTALKILFMDNPMLDKNEIVALINTVAKFSEAIRDVRVLTKKYWQQRQETGTIHTLSHTSEDENSVKDELGTESTVTQASIPLTFSSLPSLQVNSEYEQTTDAASPLLPLKLVDISVGLIASLGREKMINFELEGELIRLAFRRQPELLLLAKHYENDSVKFLQLLSETLSNTNVSIKNVTPNEHIVELPDAIVVGSGLAGMAATLNILDRGGRVVLLEKEHLLGGNSNKASSGINACCPSNTSSLTDSMQKFETDTLKSAGEAARPELVATLVSRSASAVEWLRTRVGVDLSLTSQLGGHSDKRTHRPNNGMVGAEIIYGMQKAIKAYERTGRVKISVDAKVTKLLIDEVSGSVTGVEYFKTDDVESSKLQLKGMHVVLTSGGFAADRSQGSFLEKYRPELLKMPTTAGAFSTGDGIALATSIGAGIVDMDKVQVHPTGWVDPADPDNTSKTLAAELMRGVGGILLNDAGLRFCNELGTRSYVTDKMLSHDPNYARSGKWNSTAPIPTFSMVLSEFAASGGTKKHVDLYSRKGLMVKLQGLEDLAKWMGMPKESVKKALKEYQDDAAKGIDKFGKITFPNVFKQDLDKETFYAGKVTPVLHYCMGGITINTKGNVLHSETGENIPGLYAAGEVTGGVHGVNRLGGNSLLECTVFGSIVGETIPIQEHVKQETKSKVLTVEAKKGTLTSISLAELQKHNSPDDCWVAIHGVVYDLTAFADEHPAGADSIHELAGMDGTEAFDAVHNKGILDDFDDEKVGLLSIS